MERRFEITLIQWSHNRKTKVLRYYLLFIICLPRDDPAETKPGCFLKGKTTEQQNKRNNAHSPYGPITKLTVNLLCFFGKILG